jgi:hypothetical protein
VNGVTVIDSSGSIKADIKEALAQGSIYIGDASGVTSELSVKTDTGFLVGNGTTAIVRTMSGNATMSNTGVVTVTSSLGAFYATGDVTNASGIITSTKTDAGAAGATITARQVSVSPATNDIPGSFDVSGKDSAANDTIYAQIQGVIDSPTDGAEISSVHMKVQNGTGFPAEAAVFGHNGSSKYLRTGLVETDANVGTVGTGVTAKEYGDGTIHRTVLTLTAVSLGAPTAGGNSAHGALIYTFPAGTHLHSVTGMSVGLTVGTVTTDTPDVGIGSVIGSGAQALLSGVGATSEDYITGQTAADCAATPTVVEPIGAVAGIHTGISLNGAAAAKTVHLNAADGWAAGVTGNLTADGEVTLVWTTT